MKIVVTNSKIDRCPESCLITGYGSSCSGGTGKGYKVINVNFFFYSGNVHWDWNT